MLSVLSGCPRRECIIGNLNPESRNAIFDPKPRLTPLMVSPVNNHRNPKAMQK